MFSCLLSRHLPKISQMPIWAELVRHRGAGIANQISIRLYVRMTAPEIFQALADPTRRAVFERLVGGELSVTELKAGFAVSQPAISQHLAALRRAGLVAERRDGRFVYYRAAPEGLAPLAGWIDRYRAFWPEKVARLKTLLEDMDDE